MNLLIKMGKANVSDKVVGYETAKSTYNSVMRGARQHLSWLVVAASEVKVSCKAARDTSWPPPIVL